MKIKDVIETLKKIDPETEFISASCGNDVDLDFVEIVTKTPETPVVLKFGCSQGKTGSPFEQISDVFKAYQQCRNQPCRCGSGLKYKKCCEKKDFGHAVGEKRKTLKITPQ
jgi:hypothetical protein